MEDIKFYVIIGILTLFLFIQAFLIENHATDQADTINKLIEIIISDDTKQIEVIE